MKQTAVEWLVEQYLKRKGFLKTSDIEQALEMEKVQHKKTWAEGLFCETGDLQAFEEYYNETFKSE